jgi:hypothetical protein
VVTVSGKMASPSEELVMKRNVNGAHVGARPTQATGVRKLGVARGVATRLEYGADRPGNRGFVAVSARASVDRASIQAGTTADAGEGVAKGRLPEEMTASVVDNDDMQFGFGAFRVLRLARAAIV